MSEFARKLLLLVVLLTVGNWGVLVAAQPPAEALETLKEAGLNPRLNEQGKLHAIYGMKPAQDLTPAVWEILRQAPALRQIQANQLSQEQVSEIARIRQLDWLNLNCGTDLDVDRALGEIAQLSELKYLNLHHSRNFRGTGLEHLRAMPQLEELTLHNLRPFDAPEILAPIQDLPNLREMHLTAVLTVDLEDLQVLRGHPRLEALVTPVGEDLTGFLDLLQSLPALKRLWLLFPPGQLRELTETELAILLKFPEDLTRIEAMNLQLSAAQFQKLRQAYPQAEMRFQARDDYHGETRVLDFSEDS